MHSGCVCDWYGYWDVWCGWRTRTNGRSCNYVPVLSWCSFYLHISPSVTAVFLLVALELKISFPHPILPYLSNLQHPSEIAGVGEHEEIDLFLGNYGKLNKIKRRSHEWGWNSTCPALQMPQWCKSLKKCKIC